MCWSLWNSLNHQAITRTRRIAKSSLTGIGQVIILNEEVLSYREAPFWQSGIRNRCFVRSTEEDWSEMGSNVSDGDPSATDAAVDMSQSHTPVGTVSDDAPSVAMDEVDSAQEHTMMVPHGLDADCTVSVEPSHCSAYH